MTWLGVLEILAVLMALMAVVLALGVLVQFARRLLPKRPKQVKVIQVKETKKEKPKMSKDTASEGVTFNDIFMFMIAVPLVLLWVGFAGFVIHSGLQDEAVLEQIEGYTSCYRL